MKRALLIALVLIVMPGSLTAWPLIGLAIVIGRRVGWEHG